MGLSTMIRVREQRVMSMINELKIEIAQKLGGEKKIE